MPDRTLLDRMHREMLESRRAWSADELGTSFLKLTGGALAAPLLRRILSPDARFVEDDSGEWVAREVARQTLDEGSYLLLWLEAGTAAGELRAHLLTWEAGVSRSIKEPVRSGDVDRWAHLLRTYAEHRWASWQAGAVHRLLKRLDRDFAAGELDPPPLDLAAFARLALAIEGVGGEERRRLTELEALAAHWRLGPLAAPEEGPPTHTLVALLELLLERHGAWTADELRARAEMTFAARPVSFDRFRFGPEDLAALPAAPGVYRFYGTNGELLYVGKSGRLDRRVSSYFRPLPAEPSQREELLRDVASLEWEELPSELEARLRESEEIRHRSPRRNVQVQVHPPEVFPPDFFWPLLFVAPGENPLRRTVVFLEGKDRGHLLHIERGAPPEDSLVDWLDQRLATTGDATLLDLPDGLRAHPLEPPEAWLVLRYWLARRDEIPRVDPVSVVSGLDAARALVSLG